MEDFCQKLVPPLVITFINQDIGNGKTPELKSRVQT